MNTDIDSLFGEMGDDPLDREAERMLDRSRSKQKGWVRKFTLLPRQWELRLHDATRVASYRLALELTYRHWLGTGESIAVTNAIAEAVNLSARSKTNALTELERLGLIAIDRSKGRSPRVTLLFVSEG